jgi:formate hydrogenlyase subunit 3/multisubunit Na+/H+ antiporter MnhD subunit
MLRLDNLSSFILLAIGVFIGLILLYSLKFMRGKPHLGQYYLYLILTALASVGVVLANNLILLLVFWGFLGLTLFLLINMGGPQASEAAKKTFIIVGGSDCLMLLGIGIIYYLTGTFQMDRIQLTVNSSQLTAVAYLCLAIACFAKAGAMPFHSWIPDCAESAPIPVTAFLPASLDKLLGIYLLARISMDLFVMTEAMNIFLMLIGAITILAAVMMALIQHNLKRLLGYHAVSQVGYMVLGIGTGNPIGIAGGLFHMLNNAIYKSCLFLTAGAVEYKTGTAELDKLGGLSKVMPITFFSCLIASLSISGVPPLNGFVSKWMVYQGLISQLRVTSYELRVTSILCLVAAMFGSGLTLASFVKLLHTVFLGQSTHQLTHAKHEVSWTMWLPTFILAGLCIIFGVFAFQIPLKYFIFPSLTVITQYLTPILIGFWSPSWATLLILIGLILGIIIYSLGKFKVREDMSYIGGESLPKEVRLSGVDFYQTVKDLRYLRFIYKKAEEKNFDIYDQGKKIVSFFTSALQYLHNGILPTYLVWCLLGMMVIFLVLR